MAPILNILVYILWNITIFVYHLDGPFDGKHKFTQKHLITLREEAILGDPGISGRIILK
jgi:hypothetical protein